MARAFTIGMPASVSVASWIVNSVTAVPETRPPRLRGASAVPAEGEAGAAAVGREVER
jgi:hypothetical protein